MSPTFITMTVSHLVFTVVLQMRVYNVQSKRVDTLSYNPSFCQRRSPEVCGLSRSLPLIHFILSQVHCIREGVYSR